MYNVQAIRGKEIEVRIPIHPPGIPYSSTGVLEYRIQCSTCYKYCTYCTEVFFSPYKICTYSTRVFFPGRCQFDSVQPQIGNRKLGFFYSLGFLVEIIQLPLVVWWPALAVFQFLTQIPWNFNEGKIRMTVRVVHIIVRNVVHSLTVLQVSPAWNSLVSGQELEDLQTEHHIKVESNQQSNWQ